MYKVDNHQANANNSDRLLPPRANTPSRRSPLVKKHASIDTARRKASSGCLQDPLSPKLALRKAYCRQPDGNATNHEPSRTTTDLLAVGDLVKERWRVIRKLGGGGFGEIYEAIDTRLSEDEPRLRRNCTQPTLCPACDSATGSAAQAPPDSGIDSTMTSAATAISNRRRLRSVSAAHRSPVCCSSCGADLTSYCHSRDGPVNSTASNSDDSGLGSNSSSVLMTANGEPFDLRVAIKAESNQQARQVLRMEVAVLRRLQNRASICTLYACGKNSRFNYMVMALQNVASLPLTSSQDRNLAELRRHLPQSTNAFSPSTAIRLIVQCLDAIQLVHDSGFLHRDVKPSNFAVRRPLMTFSGDRVQVVLLDFGLARPYLLAGPGSQVRSPRQMAGFRGTLRYASPNAHQHRDLGRVDDLISLIYMLVEFYAGQLPWRRLRDKDLVGQMKLRIGLDQLQVKGKLPPSIGSTWSRHLGELEYADKPNYQLLKQTCIDWMDEQAIRMDDAFDWEQQQDNVTTVAVGKAAVAAKQAERQQQLTKIEVNSNDTPVDRPQLTCNGGAGRQKAVSVATPVIVSTNGQKPNAQPGDEDGGKTRDQGQLIVKPSNPVDETQSCSSRSNRKAVDSASATTNNRSFGTSVHISCTPGGHSSATNNTTTTTGNKVEPLPTTTTNTTNNRLVVDRPKQSTASNISTSRSTTDQLLRSNFSTTSLLSLTNALDYNTANANANNQTTTITAGLTTQPPSSMTGTPSPTTFNTSSANSCYKANAIQAILQRLIDKERLNSNQDKATMGGKDSPPTPMIERIKALRKQQQQSQAERVAEQKSQQEQPRNQDQNRIYSDNNPRPVPRKRRTLRLDFSQHQGHSTNSPPIGSPMCHRRRGLQQQNSEGNSRLQQLMALEDDRLVIDEAQLDRFPQSRKSTNVNYLPHQRNHQSIDRRRSSQRDQSGVNDQPRAKPRRPPSPSVSTNFPPSRSLSASIRRRGQQPIAVVDQSTAIAGAGAPDLCRPQSVLGDRRRSKRFDQSNDRSSSNTNQSPYRRPQYNAACSPMRPDQQHYRSQSNNNQHNNNSRSTSNCSTRLKERGRQWPPPTTIILHPDPS